MNKPSMSSDAKRGSNKRKKACHILCTYSGPSYSDLPNIIAENILLRLSVKSVYVCKSVCKTWHDLISDPEFAKLHLDQAQAYPLIRTSGFVLSRMLYLVQPNQDDFELKLDCCDTSKKSELDCVCSVKVKLDTKFRLPLRNLEMMVNNNGEFDSKCETDGNNGLKLNMKDHKYRIVNSCNGLLLLSDPSNNKPHIVCNPVTGEFINIPVGRTDIFDDIFCGLGFSPVTNQYKVIRMSKVFRMFKDLIVSETHRLGTKLWKPLRKKSQYFDYSPYSKYKLIFPIYLNGYLYWQFDKRHSVISFDMEKNCLGMFSPPPIHNFYSDVLWNLTLGVLGRELCLSETYYPDHIDFWVMKDCDGKKDWLKMLSINLNRNIRLPGGPYQPIMYLNNGALLMYNFCIDSFVYYNPKKPGYRFLKIHGMQTKVEAISHIPSFVSLKDAVSGLDAKVLNVRSRCGELKLHKEGAGISIVEDSRL